MGEFNVKKFHSHTYLTHTRYPLPERSGNMLVVFDEPDSPLSEEKINTEFMAQLRYIPTHRIPSYLHYHFKNYLLGKNANPTFFLSYIGNIIYKGSLDDPTLEACLQWFRLVNEHLGINTTDDSSLIKNKTNSSEFATRAAAMVCMFRGDELTLNKAKEIAVEEFKKGPEEGKRLYDDWKKLKRDFAPDFPGNNRSEGAHKEHYKLAVNYLDQKENRTALKVAAAYHIE